MEKKTKRTPRVNIRTASGAQDEGGGVFPFTAADFPWLNGALLPPTLKIKLKNKK